MEFRQKFFDRMGQAIRQAAFPLLIFAVLALSAPVRAGDWTLAETYSRQLSLLMQGQDLPRSVMLDGERLYLAFLADGSGRRFVEYVPRGESLKNWEQMLSAHHHHARTAEQLFDERRNAVGTALQVLYSSSDKQEFVIAHPMIGRDFAEYLMIHLRNVPGGALATSWSHRIYRPNDTSLEAFRMRMIDSADHWQEELRGVDAMMPPILGAYGKSMIFTRKGRENGEVWVGGDSAQAEASP